MAKHISIFLILILNLFFLSPKSVLAITDPLSVPNNKFGVHIFSEKDLPDAQKLINTSGDWGYVTFVITEGERDHDRWQKVFDQMRRDHLIPIVRLATKASGDTWEIPKIEEINNWIAFLNSLNWVIENRYVIISNEPNHSSEWGGKIDPETYATYLKNFSQALHTASPDFFVLPAGLDASANNSVKTMDETKFIRAMLKAEPDVFNFIDGWNSHSYPNPAFSGKETDVGRGTINTFDWELTYLKTLGATKSLPVFITETGWSNVDSSEDQIASRLIYAYKNVWSDSRIVAVTPFILNYPNPPFEQFSWKKADGSFYSFYTTISNLPKIAGAPKQIVKGDILAVFAQPVIPLGSEYVGAILAKNTGQSIWSQNNISIGSESSDFTIKPFSFQEIEPTRLGLIVFKAAAPENTGIYTKSLFLADTENKKITNSFSIEAYVVKIDQNQINNYFTGVQRYIKGLLKI
ncbi:MAG: hypothetical protein UU16_C0046G0006 [Candidatus Woesebacteria bacterium GW2011_GWA2_40_7]|uniref:Asl1-like glycosyl hydrolase catalytic domain-containing protein n=1 Tax=Candidatus Woesebacteria bacterium GW2011_GWA2_40_7 TaxID=1618562 RepID=A0A0G0WA73_9BACT|nr:MAG: hypothetical protein UU16_C0046G0006 [Candidatus Woesebacteria bacterium GW2011_GWA2_40_7]